MQIKKSLLWQTTQNLIRIMAQLREEGTTVNRDDLTRLINVCIDFLNGTIREKHDDSNSTAPSL